jgi:hypothetical protein
VVQPVADVQAAADNIGMLPIPLRYPLAKATQSEPIVPAKLITASLCASLVSLLVSAPCWGQQKGYGQTLGTTQREREFYNNNIRPGDGGGDPAEVPNLLGGLLDQLDGKPDRLNPTPPGSAIEQAIREFEAWSTPSNSKSIPPK